MSNVARSTPGWSVNDVPIEIVPNTSKHKIGAGETTVRFASTGGGGGRTIHTEDAETKVSMISFDMYNTPDTESLIRGWKQNIGANVVKGVQSGIGPIVGTFMSMTNDPDFEDSADGVVTVEFQGDPLGDNT